MEFDILYSDSDIMVFNKPSGIAVLPEGWDRNATYLLKELEQNFGKLWVVHRLDKITSGVFLVARNAASHRNLNIQFEQHRIIKKYHAILVGVPEWDHIEAHQPLRTNSGHAHRTVVDKIKGKQAFTNFQVLASSNDHVLIEAIPKTGRTHQIRAHASALGFPILADSLYHAPTTNIITRPALHAFSLEFLHPKSLKSLLLIADYPNDFSEGLIQLNLSTIL